MDKSDHLRGCFVGLALGDALLSSGLMSKDDKGYRLVSWEIQNANLFVSRQNGRKGGRKKTVTKDNETEGNQTEGKKTKDNQTKERESNVTEDNGNELNETERNVTGRLTQEEPKVKSGFTTLDEAKAVSQNAMKVLANLNENNHGPF